MTISLVSYPEYRSNHLLEGKVAGGDYSPAEIQRELDWASEHFAQQCNQGMVLRSETEYLALGTQRAAINPAGVLILTPRFFPLNSVTSIKLRSIPSTDWADITAVDSKYYGIGQPASGQYSWGATVRVMAGFSFTKPYSGSEEIQIVYSAGYDPAEIPGDIKDAVCLYTFRKLAAQWAAIEASSDQLRNIVPTWVDSKIEDTIARYTRRF